MLGELLEELTPKLVPHLQSVAAPDLVRELLTTLRRKSVDTDACDRFIAIGFDVESSLAAMGRLRAALYDAVEERGLAVPPIELRLLGDWFAVLSERICRQESKRYIGMLDALPDFLLLQGLDGRFIYMNTAAAAMASAMTGLPRAELAGRRFQELGMPEDFVQYIAMLTERVRTGESVFDEYLLPTPDGGRWREHYLCPVFDADRNVEVVAVANRDVHGRKVIEQRFQLLSKVGLLAAQTDYDLLLSEVARLSIPELADWCIIDAVEGGSTRRRIIAHPDSEKAGLADELLNLSVPPPLPSVSSLVAEIDHAELEARDPVFHRVVGLLGARSTMVVPLVVLGAPIAAATFVFTSERRHSAEDLALGEEVARRVAGIMENVRLQERLRKSEERFRVALASSNITVFEEDRDLRVRWMYNAAQLGFDDQSAIGRSADDFVPSDVSAEVEAIKRRVLDSGEGTRAAVATRVLGQHRHVLLNYEPIRAGDEVVGITGSAVDVTELKQAQDEIAQALAFRERVMGILSHDLRNPLSAVRGLSQLLELRENLSSAGQEDLKRIRQAAERMNEMISTILDFTQMRFRGAPELLRDRVELDSVVRDVVDELRVSHPERAIEIAACEGARGQWDAGRIAQVVSNLVANALTHGAREAPVRIAITADDDTVVLEVTNRGPAIPAPLVPNLFEPFWQAPADGEGRRSAGLGLGLYIVQQIVLAHDGAIDVRSQDDLTAFTVRLPREAAQARA